MHFGNTTQGDKEAEQASGRSAVRCLGYIRNAELSFFIQLFLTFLQKSVIYTTRSTVRDAPDTRTPLPDIAASKQQAPPVKSMVLSVVLL